MVPTSVSSQSVGCAMIARASRRAAGAEIPALRRSPGSFRGAPIAPNLLRHADEQTVVGLAALLEAAGRPGPGLGDFADWAVLAAPRYLGRAMFEVAFPQFRAEGAWGVSPHLVPAHSLHSASGTLSLAIQARGPNLGIGGAIGGAFEGLLAAATLLEMQVVPGVWLVFSGRVGALESEVGIHPPGDYEAMALALVPEAVAPDAPWLRVHPDRIEIRREVGPEPIRPYLVDWLGLDPDRADSPARRAGATLRLDAGHDASALRHTHLRPESQPTGPADGHGGAK